MRFLFFSLVLLLIAGVNFYVFYRLVCMLPPIAVFRGIVAGIGVVMVLCFFGSFFGRAFLPEALVATMYRIGTSWFFIAIYFLMIFLVFDLLRVTHLLPVANVMYKSWWGFGSVVAVVTAIFVGGHINYLNKARVELNLNVAKSGLERPLKIVSISDLHLGYVIGRGEFSKWVDLINKEQADIVLIAGDVVDNTVTPLHKERMAGLFREIQSTYGTYVIPGNHEYIAGIDASLAFFEEAGVHVLRDSYRLIDDRFYVVGRDDRSNRRRQPVQELTGSLDSTKPVIMLDHQPYDLDSVIPHGVDLQISGHTHHGQIWPVSWITNAIYELAHGYLKKGNTHFYVSSGIGLWGGRFRIGTQSEYVVITLGSESQ